jgi:hypothetical protein
MAQLPPPSVLKCTACEEPKPKQFTPEQIRVFESGATRDLDDDKLDYEGFLSPYVLQRYAEYMHRHRETAAGPRASDNWQHGVPIGAYMKSLLRHVVDLWILHRKSYTLSHYVQMRQELLCAVMFNAMGYLFELIERENPNECGEETCQR